MIKIDRRGAVVCLSISLTYFSLSIDYLSWIICIELSSAIIISVILKYSRLKTIVTDKRYVACYSQLVYLISYIIYSSVTLEIPHQFSVFTDSVLRYLSLNILDLSTLCLHKEKFTLYSGLTFVCSWSRTLSYYSHLVSFNYRVIVIDNHFSYIYPCY